MSKPTIISITDALGSEAICRRLGIGPHSVRYARTEGLFPASWYGPLREMCEAAGIDCPMDAFNWKVSINPPTNERGAA